MNGLEEHDQHYAGEMERPHTKRVRIDRQQTTMLGEPMGEREEREQKARIIAGTPNPNVYCPFCLEPQRLRFTRLFTSDGKLSKNVKCNFCKREMRFSSITLFQTPHSYGVWAAEYPYFWKIVDFEKFTKKLKELKLAEKFWEGYHEVRPPTKLDERGYRVQGQPGSEEIDRWRDETTPPEDTE